MDKNQAIIEYLLQCPQLANNPLFFNSGKANNEAKQIITIADDIKVQEPYIDGSISKKYTFTIVAFKSVNYQAIVKLAGEQYKHENVSDMFDVQAIIDWISEQEEKHNYPNFGNDCIVEKIYSVTEDPNLNGIDTSTNPPLAKYSISIQIDYMDYSKVVFKPNTH